MHILVFIREKLNTCTNNIIYGQYYLCYITVTVKIFKTPVSLFLTIRRRKKIIVKIIDLKSIKRVNNIMR